MLRSAAAVLVASMLLAPLAASQDAPPGPPTDRAVSGSCADPRHAQPSPHTTTVSFENVGNVDLYAFSYDLDGNASAPIRLPPRSTTGPLATTPNTPWTVTDAAAP